MEQKKKCQGQISTSDLPLGIFSDEYFSSFFSKKQVPGHSLFLLFIYSAL